MGDVDAIERLLQQVLPATMSFRALSTGDRPGDALHREEARWLSDRAVRSRRESFRLGRAAARDALHLLGAGRPTIGIGTGREPLWPAGVVGSITHAGPYAVAAVAWMRDAGGVGIDLEFDRPFAGLRERVAFGVEREWLDALGAEEAGKATIEIFSAKEAVFKAFYPRIGEFFGFEAATLEPGSAGGRYFARLADGLDVEYPHTRRFPVDTGWHEGVLLSAVTLDPD